MNDLLEKIKSLDKRVLIGGGIGVAVVIILVIALIIGGENNKSNVDDTQPGTETGTQSGTEVLGTENLDGTEVLGTEIGTEINTEINTEIGTELDSTEVDGQLGSGVTNPSEEEIIGSGNASDPYLETPNIDDMTLITTSIPAGQSVYYGIYRVGGMWLEINNPNVYVIEEDGTRHDAKNGVVEFKVDDKMPNEYVVLQIGNKGSSATSFKLSFGNIKGSQANPEKIGTVGSFTKTIAAGNDKGYFYKYKAEQAGVIRFYFSKVSKDCTMSVTNNAGGATVQKTFDTKIVEEVNQQPEDYNVDEQGRRYVEMTVNAGDEIIIAISAMKYRGEYPQVDCTWVAEYR